MQSEDLDSESELPTMVPTASVFDTENPSCIVASLGSPSDAECYAHDEDSSDEHSNSESDYESSSESEDEVETFAQKRNREESSREQHKSPSKYQKRDPNTLPRRREPVKPVLNPLSAEEKKKRSETRKRNREQVIAQNYGIIGELFKPLQSTLVSHKHLKHFRTDLHHYIDIAFSHRRRAKGFRKNPDASKAPAGSSAQPSGGSCQSAHSILQLVPLC
jgi:hypothetical protein